MPAPSPTALQMLFTPLQRHALLQCDRQNSFRHYGGKVILFAYCAAAQAMAERYVRVKSMRDGLAAIKEGRELTRVALSTFKHLN